MPQPVQRSAAQVGLGLARAARGREREEEREIGGRLVEHAGCVADRDPARLGRGDVHVVVADGDVGDDPEPVTARVEHRRVDPVGEQADERVDLADRGHELIGRERRVVLALEDLVAGRDERIQPTGGEPAGDEDPAHSWFV